MVSKKRFTANLKNSQQTKGASAYIHSTATSAIHKVKQHKIITILAIAIIVGLVLALFYFATIQSNRTPKKSGSSLYTSQLPSLKKNVDKNPNVSSAHQQYAIALYATGNLKAAESEYKKATNLNNKDAVSYNNLGNTYRDLKQYNDAVSAYKKAISIDKTNINSYANLANVQFYSLSNHADAIATYKSGLQALPDNSQLEILLAVAYEQDGQTNAALTEYRTILMQDPNNPTATAAIQRLTK